MVIKLILGPFQEALDTSEAPTEAKAEQLWGFGCGTELTVFERQNLSKLRGLSVAATVLELRLLRLPQNPVPERACTRASSFQKTLFCSLHA